jgi:hypothetical protein
MQRGNQFSLVRLLSAVTLLSVACWFLSDFVCGTWRSLLDGPGFLACVAAAFTSLIGNAKQTCVVWLLMFALVPISVGTVCLLFLLALRGF